MGDRSEAIPLTNYQAKVIRLLAVNRSPDNHLAGGAALHRAPNSKRYSNDLDYFQDSMERVASAFHADVALLESEGFDVLIDLKQPGYIRARVQLDAESTKIEWAHDSAWRFLPTEADAMCGYVLHPLDVAINKLLALVGREEPRDFIDVLEVHKNVLPLGALIWAGSGKDPGFTPLSLFDLLRRKGKYREEDFSRLFLTEPPDLPSLKIEWRDALQSAEQFIRERDPKEVGCLYYSTSTQSFFAPRKDEENYQLHFGRPGGVLPLPAR